MVKCTWFSNVFSKFRHRGCFTFQSQSIRVIWPREVGAVIWGQRDLWCNQEITSQQFYAPVIWQAAAQPGGSNIRTTTTSWKPVLLLLGTQCSTAAVTSGISRGSKSSVVVQLERHQKTKRQLLFVTTVTQVFVLLKVTKVLLGLDDGSRLRPEDGDALRQTRN